MLVKGKRTFESFMNSVSLHLSSSDWEPEEGVEEPSIIFGDGEWTALIVLDADENIYGVELENSTYSDIELAIVEKAICLLEGIKWSEETKAPEEELEEKPRRRKHRKNGESPDADVDHEE